ncbi:MAG: hypothetical protein IPN71_18325 [Fibrobacteres bacterium]|nr:hypothetical protein [Fibrobacterota bacterium]
MLSAQNVAISNRSGTIAFDASVTIADDLSVEIRTPNLQDLRERFASFRNQFLKTGVLTEDSYCQAAFAADGVRIQACDILIDKDPAVDGTDLVFCSRVDSIVHSDQPPSDMLELELDVGLEAMLSGLGILGDSFDSMEFGKVEFLAGTAPDRCLLRSQLKSGIAFAENKILEAVRFVSGIDAQWVESRVAGKRTVRSPRPVLYADPACSPMPQGDRASAIKMFDAVVRWVGLNKGSHTSSETDTLANLRQASPSHVNFRLILGAAVEHLLKRFPGEVVVDRETLQHIEESIFMLDGTGFHRTIKEKLKSALVNQRNLQPKQVLAAMKAMGMVSSLHIKTYENIRTMGSQGGASGLKEANDTKRKTAVVLDLVYRILLNGISYTGKYRSPIDGTDTYFRANVVA